MYPYFLIVHSYLRWLVLGSLLFALTFIIIKKHQKAIYTYKNYQLIKTVTTIFNIQFLVGIILLTLSPTARIFWLQISQSLKWREPRFFGLEHPFMMIFGVLLLNVITYKSVEKIDTKNGFKYLFFKFLILLLILLTSIPWSFSPFTSRPDFRFF